MIKVEPVQWNMGGRVFEDYSPMFEETLLTFVALRANAISSKVPSVDSKPQALNARSAVSLGCTRY